MSNCKACFLSDAPSASDAFGAHNKIADAIVGLTKEGEGGKAIALFGDWGSGKSTVVGFIKKQFEDTKTETKIKEKVFVFDAWAHQGDPLRRAFIESLVSALIPWITPREWEKELGQLSRKIVDTETKSEPAITTFGKLILASLLFYPIGFSFFGTLASKDFNLLPQWGLPFWIWGIIILGMPFLIALSEYIYKLCGGRSDGDYFSLFINKTTVNQRTTSITTINPTTIEFQEILKRILGKALNDAERRLVIVVDNLDRVDTKDALEIWSTMRTLFEFDSSQKMSWMKSFWLVVPMDKSALCRLWGTNDGSVEADSDSKLVDAFVEKTFQMEFRVSPPVLSQWKTYFIEQLKLAFPDHAENEDELLTIFRLYRQRIVSKQGRITPRDVKLFINRIVALHLLWGDKIPFVSQALYVLYAEQIRNSEANLIKWEFVDARVRNIIIWQDWQKDLIALHFGVEKEKGLQVLIGQKVEESLSTGKDISEYKTVPGFYDLLEDTVLKNHEAWAKEEPASLALAATSILSLSEDSGSVSGPVWQWLSLSIGKVSVWQNLNSSVGIGIVSILKNTKAENFDDVAGRVVKSLTKQLVGPANNPEANLLKGWIECVSQIVEYLNATKAVEPLRNFEIPGEAKDYIEIALIVAENPKFHLLQPYLTPKAGKLQVVTVLATLCQSGVFRERHANAVAFLAKIWGDISWEQLVNAISVRLGIELTAPELIGCLKTLLFLKDKDQKFSGILNALCVNGHIPHNLARIDSENPKANALVAMAIFLVQAAGGSNTNTRNSNAGRANYKAILSSPEGHPKILSEFASLSVELSVIEKLFEIKAVAPVTERFVSLVLSLLAQREDACQRITMLTFINNAEYLKTSLPEPTLTKIVGDFVEHADIVAQLLRMGFEKKYVWLYRLVLGQKSKADGSLPTFVAKGFASFTKAMWLEEINKESDCLDLLLQLIERNVPIGLSQEFHDALIEHAEKLILGAQTVSRLKGQWTRLLEALEIDWRRTLKLTLRDKLISHAKEKLEIFLSVYVPILSESELFVKDSDRVILGLASEIIEKKSESEIAWLETILTDGKIFSASEKETRHSFRERIRKMLGDSSLSESIGLRVKSIAKLLEIE